MPPSPEQIALTRANRIYLWAISLAALFGAVGIGATAFIINYSDKVGEAQSNQIRQLERDRDVARAEATAADARIADANARAEEAVKQTAEARLATEELRKETMGRQFTDEQLSKMNRLKDSGITIKTNINFGDPEAAIYAVQLITYLRGIGLNMPNGEPVIGMMYFGIKVSG